MSLLANPLSTPSLWRPLAAGALLGALSLSLTGCPAEFGDEPTIVSMSITPAILSLGETGMTDEFFTVNMEIANFTETIAPEGVEVYIELSGSREIAEPAQVVIEGNFIRLTGIQKSWFGGLSPAVYPVGASVTSVTGLEQTQQSRLAEVTITP